VTTIYQVEFSDYDEHTNYGCFFSREAAEQHMENLEAEGHGTAGDTLTITEEEVLAHAPEWFSWYSIRASWGEGSDQIDVYSHPSRSYGTFDNTGEPYVNAQPRRYHHGFTERYHPAAVHVALQTLDEEAGKALALRTAEVEIAKIKAAQFKPKEK
jgi:hypothetical protein